MKFSFPLLDSSSASPLYYFTNVCRSISLLNSEFLEIKDCVLLICVFLMPGIGCIKEMFAVIE